MRYQIVSTSLAESILFPREANNTTKLHSACNPRDFLIKSMIEEAKTLDVDGVGILVDACNVKAYNLYLKHGFIKEGEDQFPFAYLDILGLYW